MSLTFFANHAYRSMVVNRSEQFIMVSHCLQSIVFFLLLLLMMMFLLQVPDSQGKMMLACCITACMSYDYPCFAV